ncbi:MAG: zinc-ribbon domain-containing protein [Alphaproteobacteria bacterium]
MQITCPNCNKKYAIEPSQIGEMGRKVQCSQCKHIWFAKPDDLTEPTVTPLKPEDKEIKSAKQPVKDKSETAEIMEEVPTKTVHETIVKNLPVVIEQDINQEIKEALIRSQNLNGRLSTMLFATNVLILGLLIILILLLM